MNNLFLTAYPGDSFGTVWMFWQRRFTGIYSWPHPRQLLFVYLGDLLTWLTNEVLAYNLTFLGSLALAFALTYRLGRRLGWEKSGAVMSALIYTVSQNFFWQGTQHLELVLGAAFIPFLVETLLANHFFQSVLAFALVFYSSFNLGYFCLLLLPPFFLFKKEKLTKVSLWIFLAFIVASPATVPLIRWYFQPKNEPQINEYMSTNLIRNTPDEVFRLTARPWDFLLPSQYHPLFGGIVKTFYEKVNPKMSWQLWSAYLPERAIFWGWTATLLTLLALIPLPECNRGAVKASRRMLLLLLLFSLWLSLPPYFSLHGYKIPFSPSFFLVKFFPMFRAYIRINFFTKLFLALLAGQGVAILTKKLAHPKLVATVIITLIIFENLTFLPRLNVNQLPPLYAWLKNQPTNILVVEYPQDMDLAGGCDANLKPEIIKGYSYTYSLNFQRLHQHQLFKTWELPKATQKDLWDLTNPAVYRFLKNNGVTHVLAHTTDYFAQPPNPFDRCQGRRFYRQEPVVYEKIVKEAAFPDGIVYRLL